MKNPKEYINKRYGNFTIKSFVKTEIYPCGRYTHIFKGICENCQNEHIQKLNTLRSRKPTYCIKCKGQRYITHGLNKSGIYHSWQMMKDRCTNKNAQFFNRYGGRGITYPKKWETFEQFLKDMGNSWKPYLTLERIDNNKGYSKQNCRWATRYEQQQNKSNSIILEYKGKKQSLSQWSKELNISYQTIYTRYYRNMPIEKILKK